MTKLSQMNVAPRYPVTIPSTGKRTTFRPFLVKEERALLTAQESDDIATKLHTMESVVRNCTENLPKELTTFDLEYLMTLIRAKSVGETSDLIFSCDSCNDPNAEARVSVDLSKVQVSDRTHPGKIKLNENLTAVLKYPSVQDVIDIHESDDKSIALIKKCLDKLFTDEESFDLKEESDEEIDEFLETLTVNQKEQIQHFVDSIPHAYINVGYTCPSCGKFHDRQLKGINNFF